MVESNSTLDSWVANDGIWGKAFLSWNKERPDLYYRSAHMLRDCLRRKGMDLIIDMEFDPTLLKDNNGYSLDLCKHTFVFLSEDYVSSSKCVHEGVAIVKSGFAPCPFFFYNENEDTDEDWYNVRMDRYTHLALQATQYHYSEVEIRNAITFNFLRVFEHPNQSIPEFASLNAYSLSHQFPDYDTFIGLEYTVQCLSFHLEPECETKLKYIGIMGEKKINKMIVKALRSLSMVSSYSIKSLLLDGLPYKKIPDLTKRGLILYDLLFGKQTPCNKDEKYLLLLENAMDFSQIEALSTVSDFINSASIIVFTTTSSNLFIESDVNWTCNGLYGGVKLYISLEPHYTQPTRVESSESGSNLKGKKKKRRL